MATEVTPARVRATADLARLDLTEAELGPMAAQLQRILDHIDTLDALVDDAAVDDPTRVARTPLRDDTPHECIPRDLALSQAPRAAHGAFVVPQFVEE